MDTPVGGKKLSEYIDIIKIPLIALIGLDIVSFLMSFLSYIPAAGFAFTMLNLAAGVVIFILTLAIAGYIGYTTVRKHSGDLLTALAAGAIAGAISGVVSGLLSIVSAMAGTSARPGFGSAIIIVAALAGLIASPIAGAIVDGILSVIGGLAAGARTFGTPAAAAADPKADARK